MRFVVYHKSYGCDTGCCGHYVDVFENTDPGRFTGQFQFTHPYTDDPSTFRTWAERLISDLYGPEHIEDLDWSNCQISND